MFNKQFNLPEAVGDMPLSIRKQVLFSLVGSLNATVVGMADSIVQRLLKDGYQICGADGVMNADHMLNAQQIADFMDDPDFSATSLQEARCIVSLTDSLRGKLQFDTGTNGPDIPEVQKMGTLGNTLRMMTGPQNMRGTDPNALEVLRALDIVVTPAQIEAARMKQHSRDQMFADARSQRRGEIEFVLDNVFQYEFDEDIERAERKKDDAGEYYTGNLNVINAPEWFRLSEERREIIASKLTQALSNAFAKATENVILGVKSTATFDALGASDLPLIRNEIDHINLMIHVKRPETPPAVEKPTAKSVRKPKTVKPEELKDAVKAAAEGLFTPSEVKEPA